MATQKSMLSEFSWDQRYCVSGIEDVLTPALVMYPDIIAAGEGAKYQVSTAGGWLPRFSQNHEFYFVTMGNRLMQAQTADQPNFHINSIRALFQFDFPNFPSPLWDVSADGQRFAVLTADHTKSASITLLTNWPAELGK
jgi:hypothetical protein